MIPRVLVRCQVKVAKGQCTTRWTDETTVNSEVNRPVTAPSALIAAHKADEQVQVERKPERPDTEPVKIRFQKQQNSANLNTIKEGQEGNMSSGYSLNTGSSKTYSFGDFKMYDDHARHADGIVTQEDVLDLDGHSPVVDDAKSGLATSIQGVFKVPKSSTERSKEPRQSKRRRSQLNELINRRDLTPYMTKRLLEQSA